jgi:two-component system OmpR family response regulator
MSVLIIEDNRTVAENIRRCLEVERCGATVAPDGEEGARLALLNEYECIILDLNLPRMDGMAVCALLRREGKNTPILMLTARAGKKDIIAGLDCGADDYLVKPFDMEELLARVRTLRRRPAPERAPILSVQDISIDTNAHEVRRKGKVVALAPREYALLEHLMRHKGVVQDRMTLIEHVWGEDDELLFSHTVDVHISFLRRKLGKRLIRTVPGAGYLISDPAP